MGAPIPREVLAIIEAQQAALAKVIPKHRDRLLAIALEVQSALERRLKALAPERYTTQEVRVLLTQVRAVVELLGAELGTRMGKELRNIGEVAAKIGRDGLVDQVAAWADKFQGSVRRIAPAEVAGDLLDEGLLEYYESSKQTYGLEAIAKMRGVLAKSVLEGKTVAQASEALSAAVELQDWRAERIVRTEQSFAAHRRQIEDAKALDLGLAKQLVTTFDDRTGEDSQFVDGQTRELDEPFSDNEGRVYQHPPNRPNDREVVVFVPNTLNELGPPAADATGEWLLAGGMQITEPTLLANLSARPRGRVTRPERGASDAKKLALRRENEAAVRLAQQGYDIEQNPGENALGKRPDYRIDGRFFDCYAPTGIRARNVFSYLQDKIDEGQARRFVVNLADYQGTKAELFEQFKAWPMDGLEEVLVLDKDGTIFRLFP